MSISSLPAVKFQFPQPRDEEHNPWDREQIAALTVALGGSLSRERASQQANADLLRRQHTLALELEHRFLNGLQWITALLSLQSRTTVLDEGPGLPPEFDPARCKGLGTKIVLALVRQIRGELKITPAYNDRGTKFTVVF